MIESINSVLLAAILVVLIVRRQAFICNHVCNVPESQSVPAEAKAAPAPPTATPQRVPQIQIDEIVERHGGSWVHHSFSRPGTALWHRALRTPGMGLRSDGTVQEGSK